MRQRLALLRTFLMRRAVLLLDEPFGALDAITRRAICSVAREVWAADRRTCCSSPTTSKRRSCSSDRVVVLSARPGRVVAEVAVGLPPTPAARRRHRAGFVALQARLLHALGRRARRLREGRSSATTLAAWT